MGVTALWVGDSFTRGEGAGVPPELTYPFLVGSELGWTCRVDAQNGTGFLNDGFLAGPGLAALIGRLPATSRAGDADVVVVDAGRNDGIAAEPGLRAAPDGYLSALRAAFPTAHDADVVHPAAVEGFADTADGRDLVCLDGFHPSAAGQEHYAEVLVPLLRGIAGRIGP